MTSVPAPRPKSARSHQHGMAYAADLILQTCRASPDLFYLRRLRTDLTRTGIKAAVATHDTPVLFGWLMDVLSYQGVSDAVAWAYMEQHGRIAWTDIDAAFNQNPSCPKLKGYAALSGCRYSKGSGTCAKPDYQPHCPLPRHDLRKGALNRAAYALYLFLRDECAGDFVTWIDRRLAQADAPGAPDRAIRLRHALLDPLGAVYGVGPKVLSMALSAVLLGADPKRERWVYAGAHLIVIDTLVHNWMHRTGILRRLGAEHAYGPGCYRPGGCASIIEQAAEPIDARAFNPSFPQPFPRYVQIAIWRLCAQAGLGLCNGLTIDDRTRCANAECPLFRRCDRVPLRPVPSEPAP
jgi:hypothetical protein